MSSVLGLLPGDYAAYARIEGPATLQSEKVTFAVR